MENVALLVNGPPSSGKSKFIESTAPKCRNLGVPTAIIDSGLGWRFYSYVLSKRYPNLSIENIPTGYILDTIRETGVEFINGVAVFHNDYATYNKDVLESPEMGILAGRLSHNKEAQSEFTEFFASTLSSPNSPPIIIASVRRITTEAIKEKREKGGLSRKVFIYQFDADEITRAHIAGMERIKYSVRLDGLRPLSSQAVFRDIRSYLEDRTRLDLGNIEPVNGSVRLHRSNGHETRKTHEAFSLIAQETEEWATTQALRLVEEYHR